MNTILVLVLLGAAVSTSWAANIENCGSHDVDIESFSVSNCSEDKPVCPLQRGTTATITIKFTPRRDMDSLATVVHGVIGGIPMPFAVPQPDACENSGLKCPLKAGESYTYKATLPVKKMYPTVKVIVKWELQQGDKTDAVCLRIPSKIV